MTTTDKKKTKAARTGRAHLTVTRPTLLRGGSDDTFRQFVHDSLSYAVRLLAVRDHYGQLMGITGPQYTILISVARLAKDGSVSVSDVARHLHLTGSFITSETGKLASEGLLDKTTDEDDRRRTNLSITDAGWRRFDRLAGIQPQVNDAHFDCLDAKSFDQMRALMPRLVDSTDRALSLLQHLIATAR